MTAPSLEDFAAWQEREASLQLTIQRLMRDLDKAKRSQVEYKDTLYQAVRDAMGGLKIPAVPPPLKVKKSAGEEVAVPLLSDIQLAKVTFDENGDVSYDSTVAEKRVEMYAKKIIEITEIQRMDHPVKHCRVQALGDIIEGECIFPGQVHLIDGGLYRQIVVDGPRIVTNFIRTLLTSFETVTVDWTIGNHGRIGGYSAKDHDPETNGDRMLGKILEMLFANEPRVTFNVRDGRRDRNWYGITEIGNYRALTIHGDQIRGHSGFPFYGLGKKVNGWAAGAIPEQFTDVFMGHWHQRALIPLNKRDVYVNGSTESYNTYAQENLAAMSDPSQWLLFVHPVKGRVTASYGVDLLS